MARGNQTGLLAAVVVLAVVVFLVWSFWPGQREGGGGPTTQPSGQGPGPAAKGGEVAAAGAPEIPVGLTRPKMSAQQAGEAYKAGLSLVGEGKLVEGRGKLAGALLSGKLPGNLEPKAREALTDLADKTFFSRRLFRDDPYTFAYKLQPGEVLTKVERKLKLRVPWQLILRINRIRDARKIEPADRLKMIRGPFHAVVTKSEYAMDVYLQDAFVRRFKVGIGAAETPTPEGFFRATLGGKLTNATYTPPASTGKPQIRIFPGQRDYPLDKGGHWISLCGIPEKGNDITDDEGYGIHGTNDPDSIGRPVSMGCIRLSDKDIKLLFGMLYEKWSTVEVRP